MGIDILMAIVKSNKSGYSPKKYELTEKQKFVARLISDYGYEREEAVKWCWIFNAFNISTCGEALETYESRV